MVINAGLPSENATARADTIWDKIRRFFIPDAVAQTPPANFDSYLVRVTASDMTTIDHIFIGTVALSLEVPAGSARLIEVTAHVNADDPSAAQSFRGRQSLGAHEVQ